MKTKSEVIKELLDAIRKNSMTYQQMLDRLTEAGMNDADARKLLDRLTNPLEDDE